MSTEVLDRPLDTDTDYVEELSPLVIPEHVAELLKMPIHPLAEIYPPMTDEEYNVIYADIQRNGRVNRELITFGEYLLDGRHRRRAIQEILETTGGLVEFKVREFDPLIDGDPGDFVISENGARRHMSASQKAVSALRFFDRFTEEVKKASKKKLSEQQLGASAQRAAALTGVSEKYIRLANEVRQARPELLEQVFSGDWSLPAALRVVKRESQEAKDTKDHKEGKPVHPALSLPWKHEISAMIDFDYCTHRYYAAITMDTHDNGQVIYRVECGYLLEEIVQVFDRFDVTSKLAEAQSKAYETCEKHATNHSSESNDDKI